MNPVVRPKIKHSIPGRLQKIMNLKKSSARNPIWSFNRLSKNALSSTKEKHTISFPLSRHAWFKPSSKWAENLEILRAFCVWSNISPALVNFSTLCLRTSAPTQDAWFKAINQANGKFKYLRAFYALRIIIVALIYSSTLGLRTASSSTGSLLKSDIRQTKKSNYGPQSSARSYPQVSRHAGDDESTPRPIGSQFWQILKKN